jgi:hypothetical protein
MDQSRENKRLKLSIPVGMPYNDNHWETWKENEK